MKPFWSVPLGAAGAVTLTGGGWTGCVALLVALRLPSMLVAVDWKATKFPSARGVSRSLPEAATHSTR